MSQFAPGKELQWILQGGAEWRAAGFPDIQELVKPDPDDPATFINTDVRNAFNETCRQTTFDT